MKKSSALFLILFLVVLSVVSGLSFFVWFQLLPKTDHLSLAWFYLFNLISAIEVKVFFEKNFIQH